MLDRWGEHIRVAWAAHEIVWLEAALTLCPKERRAALHDIAAMSSRTIGAVRTKLQTIKDARQAVVVEKRPEPLAPSALRPPSRAQLTGGSARVSRRHIYREAAE